MKMKTRDRARHHGRIGDLEVQGTPSACSAMNRDSSFLAEVHHQRAMKPHEGEDVCQQAMVRSSLVGGGVLVASVGSMVSMVRAVWDGELKGLPPRAITAHGSAVPDCHLVSRRRTFAVALEPRGKKVYIESYGCQMNFSDSEIVAKHPGGEDYADGPAGGRPGAAEHLQHPGQNRADGAEPHRRAEAPEGTESGPEAQCTGLHGRAHAGRTCWRKAARGPGGGPDAYRSLPQLLDEVGTGQKAVNVLLSRDRTYDDIAPVRLGRSRVTAAFISIMRGCDNMCAFCVVPFTRGGNAAATRDHRAGGPRPGGPKLPGGDPAGPERGQLPLERGQPGQVKDPAKPVTDFADLLALVAGWIPCCCACASAPATRRT